MKHALISILTTLFAINSIQSVGIKYPYMDYPGFYQEHSHYSTADTRSDLLEKEDIVVREEHPIEKEKAPSEKPTIIEQRKPSTPKQEEKEQPVYSPIVDQYVNTEEQEEMVMKFVSYKDKESEVLSLVNIEREAVGLPPLVHNPELLSGTLLRAHEIIEKFSHTRPDGSRFFLAFGHGFPFRNIGENLARGFQNPSQVMQGWMGSEGHRKNILNPNFNEFASAVIRCDKGVLHWVQIFYREKE